MANSILKDIHGPDWPLGFVQVITPGTPVGLMSVVDPSNINDPSTPPSFPPASGQQEYTIRCNQIQLAGYQPGTAPFSGSSPALIPNQGQVYIVRKGINQFTGAADSGTIVLVLQPGQVIYLGTSALVKDAFSPYRYFVDADNSNDGVMPVLFIF